MTAAVTGVLWQRLRPEPAAGLLRQDRRGRVARGRALPLGVPFKEPNGWSPDGRWLAYGRFELYVQSLPVPGRKVQVSADGAGPAWWTHDGRALLFVDEHRRSLWRADVQPGPTFRVGTPRQLATFPPGITWLDAMPDRQRFIAVVPEHGGAGSVTVVQGWRTALEMRRGATP